MSLPLSVSFLGLRPNFSIIPRLHSSSRSMSNRTTLNLPFSNTLEIHGYCSGSPYWDSQGKKSKVKAGWCSCIRRHILYQINYFPGLTTRVRELVSGSPPSSDPATHSLIFFTALSFALEIISIKPSLLYNGPRP